MVQCCIYKYTITSRNSLSSVGRQWHKSVAALDCNGYKLPILAIHESVISVGSVISPDNPLLFRSMKFLSGRKNTVLHSNLYDSPSKATLRYSTLLDSWNSFKVQ